MQALGWGPCLVMACGLAILLIALVVWWPRKQERLPKPYTDSRQSTFNAFRDMK